MHHGPLPINEYDRDSNCLRIEKVDGSKKKGCLVGHKRAESEKRINIQTYLAKLMIRKIVSSDLIGRE